MTLDPPGKFQFEEESGDRGSCQLALAHQFVNRDRRRSQTFEDHVQRVLVVGRLSGAARGPVRGQLSSAGSGSGVSGRGGGAARTSGPSCDRTSSVVSVK